MEKAKLRNTRRVRSQMLHIRLDDQQFEALKQLADRRDLPWSVLVRSLVDQELRKELPGYPEGYSIDAAQAEANGRVAQKAHRARKAAATS